MTQENLIRELIEDGYLKTPKIIDAFRTMDRRDFVPEEVRAMAYENTALPIGQNQTISQPLVVAFMLELLELKLGEKVLEIGTGSGWSTALMAEILEMRKEKSEISSQQALGIVSIELLPALHEFAKSNLAKYKFLESGGVRLVLGDGSLGYLEEAPYDKIIAAAAAEAVPDAWKEQLKIGGRIVAPVRDRIVVWDKTAKDQFQTKEFFGFAFVPLVR